MMCNYSTLHQWLLIANVKKMTFRSDSVTFSPPTSLTQDRWKYLKSVGIAAEFICKDQSDKELKTTTSVWCLTTFPISDVS